MKQLMIISVLIDFLQKISKCRKLTDKSHSFITILLLLFVFLIFTADVYAESSYTPSVLKPGATTGAKSLSDFETINPYSGNLNFKLPLLQAAGRGSNTFPVNLSIDQRWSIQHWYDESDDYRPFKYAGGIGGSQNYETPVKLVINYSGSGSDSCYNYYYTYKYSYTSISFTDFNGSQHEMRDRNTNGQPHYQSCNQNQYSRGRVFETTDGSGAIFVSDTDIKDDTYTNSGTSGGVDTTGNLTTQDGTVYRIEGGLLVWSRDKNGNKLVFTYSASPNSSTPLLSKITDSLNREITIEHYIQDVAPYGYCDRITYKGFAGGSRVIRISYKDLRQILRSGYSPQTGLQMFPNAFEQSYPLGNPVSQGFPYWNGTTEYSDWKISNVWLPDDRTYKFQYNSYGELARVEMPTGGAVEYDWGASTGSGLPNVNTADTIYRRVSERRVYTDGVNLDSKTTLGSTEYLTGITGYVIENLYNEAGNLINKTKHYYYGINSVNYPWGGPPPNSTNAINGEPWKNGREYQTDLFDSNGTTLLRSSANTWYQLQPNWFQGYPEYAPSNNPKVTETTVLLADSNQISKQTFSYDSNNNLTDSYDYDYGIGAPGQFLRRSHTDYLTTNSVNNIDYTANNVHILSLPSQVWLSSDTAGNNKASLIKYEYDNYASDQNHSPLLDRANITGHEPTYGTNYTARGSLTKITAYENAQNQTGGVSSYKQYDVAGSVVKAIDAKDHITTIDYTDRFGSPDGEARSNTSPSQLNGQQTFAFATSATNAIGYSTYAQIDYCSGMNVDGEDINGNVNTTYTNNDPLDRPKQTISANNRPQFRKQTTFIYDDINRKVTVTSDSKIFGDDLIKAESYYDKMGRTTESRQYETTSNYIEVISKFI